eukprot:jgi/Mesvir1/17506/Mv08768-RA.4
MGAMAGEQGEPSKKKSVDEIWAALNAKKSTNKPTVVGTNWNQYGQKVAPSPASFEALDSNLPLATGVAGVMPPMIGTLPQTNVRKSGGINLNPGLRDNAAPAAPSQKGNMADDVGGDSGLAIAEGPWDFDTLSSSMQRDVAHLSDKANASKRKDALKRLNQIVNEICLKADADVLKRLAIEVLGKPLVRLLDDAVEKCRELAISTLHRLLQSSPSATIQLLPYTLAALGERLRRIPPPGAPPMPTAAELAAQDRDGPSMVPTGPPAEPSEELRLLLVGLLATVIRHAADKKALPSVAAEAAFMLMATAVDACPDVVMASCSALELYCRSLGLKLRPIAKELVSAYMVPLLHRRSRVRVAVLRALRAVVPCGGQEKILELTAFVDPNVIAIRAFYEGECKVNYFGQLVRDANAAVREEFYCTIASWMLTMDDRYSYESRLIPYILSGLSDESPALQELTYDLVEQLGKRYEEERAEELRDVKSYLPEDDARDGAGNAVFALPLPHPFRGRPGLGARMLVRGNFPRLMHPLIRELGAWTGQTRVHAAQLLRNCLVYAEDNVTQQMQHLLPGLAKSILDEDPAVATLVRESCHILGRFNRPSVYLPFLLPSLRGVETVADDELGSKYAAQTLEAVAALLRGGSDAAIEPHVPEVMCAVTHRLLLFSRDRTIRRAVARVVASLLGPCAGACLGPALFPVTITTLLHLAARHFKPGTRDGREAGEASGGRTGSEAETSQQAMQLLEAVSHRLGGDDGLGGRVEEVLDALAPVTMSPCSQALVPLTPSTDAAGPGAPGALTGSYAPGVPAGASLSLLDALTAYLARCEPYTTGPCSDRRLPEKTISRLVGAVAEALHTTEGETAAKTRLLSSLTHLLAREDSKIGAPSPCPSHDQAAEVEPHESDRQVVIEIITFTLCVPKLRHPALALLLAFIGANQLPGGREGAQRGPDGSELMVVDNGSGLARATKGSFLWSPVTRASLVANNSAALGAVIGCCQDMVEDVRRQACAALAHLVALVGGTLSEERCAQLVSAALLRIDDSSPAVRAAALRLLQELLRRTKARAVMMIEEVAAAARACQEMAMGADGADKDGSWQVCG